MIPLRDNIKSTRFAFISWIILIANCYVFYLELRSGRGDSLERFIREWAVIPRHLSANPIEQAHTLVTATFLHGGWMHIIFNMLFLYIFADNVEDRLGHIKFFIFYLLVGVAANGIQALMSPQSAIPLIGASGAIAGVLGAYFFYYPHSRIITLIPIGFIVTIREIPAYFFLGFWFLMQMLSAGHSMIVTQQSLGGVAWWAHASGFVIGLLLAPILGGKTGKYR